MIVAKPLMRDLFGFIMFLVEWKDEMNRWLKIEILGDKYTKYGEIEQLGKR